RVHIGLLPVWSAAISCLDFGGIDDRALRRQLGRGVSIVRPLSPRRRRGIAAIKRHHEYLLGQFRERRQQGTRSGAMKLEPMEGGFAIDAADLGQLLDRPAVEVQQLMRSGTLTSRFERGEGEDEGRNRLTFFDETWHV